MVELGRNVIQPKRPRIGRTQFFATGIRPALPGDLTQGSSAGPADHQLHVVVGTRNLIASCITPPLILQRMARAVPAARGDVQPTRERQAVIDHHEFLMMAGARGDASLHFEMHPVEGAMVKLKLGKPFAIWRQQRSKIPNQNVDFELAVALDQRVQ